MPIRTGSVDLVTAFDLLYHRGVDEGAALAEWRRVLAPGGILYVSDSALPCLMGPHDEAVHARERYTSRRLAEKVKAAGFEIIRETYWNSVLCPIVAAYRLARRIAARSARSDLSGVPPHFINSLLASLLRAESRWLRRLRFPVGTSVALVARKE
jgi:SAM-dependent methyltransferase